MSILFLSLLLANTLADFYTTAPEGRHPALRTALRCAAYALAVFAAAFVPGLLSAGLSGILAAALGAVCLVVSLAARSARRKWDTPKALLAVFVISQAFQAACLAAAVLAARPYISAAPWITGIPGAGRWMTGVKLLTALLMGHRPAAMLVKLVLDLLPAGGREEAGAAEDGLDASDAGGGRLIGILEREITILLMFWQQYAVIGFIMTAKSIARYKQLEKQAFAEKYLVGTLASILTALCVSLALGSLQVP